MASKIVNTKLVHFPYKVKLRLMAHSRSLLANRKARNAIIGAENLLKIERKKERKKGKRKQEKKERKKERKKPEKT